MSEKFKNIFLIICAVYLIDFKYVDGRIKLSTRSFGSSRISIPKPYLPSSGIGSGKHFNSYQFNNYGPTKLSTSSSSFDHFSNINRYSPSGTNLNLYNRPRPYPALGNERFNPHVTQFYQYPSYNQKIWSTTTTTTTTVRPTTSLQRHSVNQAIVANVKMNLKRNSNKLKDAYSITEGTYKNSKRKVLKLIDYDSKRKSYVVHPLRLDEVKFHPI